MAIPSINIANESRVHNTLAPLFLNMYNKHSQFQILASSMTANTILMTYQLTGGLYTGP